MLHSEVISDLAKERKAVLMNRCNTVLAAAALLFLSICCATADESNDVFNAVYRIEKMTVQLVNGHAESKAAPGSASRIITQAIDEAVFGDLDGDGQVEAALFLSQDSGGSGTFFYVAAAQRADGRWRGTNAVFIGDRVAPEAIHIGDGVIIVQYLDRRPEDPMTVAPSVAKTLEIELVGGHLEVLQP
jgi:hypothetical protein